MLLLTAIAVTIGSALAYHMGLTDAVGGVIQRIISCPKCLTMWSVLGILLLVCDTDPVTAVVLSIIMSYLSIWLSIIMSWIEEKYNNLYKRLLRLNR